MSEQTIELVLAGIVGEYEQGIIKERSGSPEYKSWERRSIRKLSKALNSDLLAALKLLHAWQPRLTLTAAVARAAKGQEPTDSDTAEIREWATATVDAGLAIKAAEKQSAGEQP